MDTTPRLHLPYIAPQQAQKQVTYNEAMRLLDLLVQSAVLSRSLATPPAAPAEGDSYIIAAGAGGVWAGHEQELASWIDGSWSFRAAGTGWLCFVADVAEVAVFTPAGWTSFASNGGSSIASFGINAAADLYNRFTVAAGGSLFNHDGGGHRLTLNKAGAGDTGSLVFQTGFSGRAEFGLAGDDDFHVKVSPDGSAWLEALVIGGGGGLVHLPQGQLAFPATAHPAADPHILDDYEEGSWTPGIAFGGGAVGVTYGVGTSGRFTKVGRLCVVSGTLVLTSKGSSSGAVAITGLPHAAIAGNVAAAASIGWIGGLTGISGAVSGLLGGGSDQLTLHQISGGVTTPVSDAAFGGGSELRFSVSYDAA
ncbi:MAG TPA: DUF2793 domain-containing protein [Devosiaceae bacterium]|jgi:hypothetical protein|nr:DUF2793 domain-containing protein [Devosiaceae bacterium]